MDTHRSIDGDVASTSSQSCNHYRPTYTRARYFEIYIFFFLHRPATSKFDVENLEVALCYYFFNNNEGVKSK